MGLSGMLHRAFAAAILCITTTPALAGSGSVNSDGTINLTANFRLPPSATQITTAQNNFIEASRLLWDATEGQLLINNVGIQCSRVNEDQADFWLFAQPLRFNSCLGCLTTAGGHATQSIHRTQEQCT